MTLTASHELICSTAPPSNTPFVIRLRLFDRLSRGLIFLLEILFQLFCSVQVFCTFCPDALFCFVTLGFICQKSAHTQYTLQNKTKTNQQKLLYNLFALKRNPSFSNFKIIQLLSLFLLSKCTKRPTVFLSHMKSSVIWPTKTYRYQWLLSNYDFCHYHTCAIVLSHASHFTTWRKYWTAAWYRRKASS